MLRLFCTLRAFVLVCFVSVLVCRPIQPRLRLLEMVRRFGVKYILAGHTHTTETILPRDLAFTIYTTGEASAPSFGLLFVFLSHEASPPISQK